METGWEGMLLADGQRIVYPVNDLKGHYITSDECWCHPYKQDDVLVHKSADSRETYERGERKHN